MRQGMATPEHLDVLSQGTAAWNQWRRDFPHIRPNLRKANLRNRRDLEGVDFSDVNLRRADLRNADLSHAYMRRADLRRANLSDATLRGADLTSAILIETNLERAVLDGCHVYGVSAWNLKLDGASQKSLVVSKKNEALFTVDNIEVAQFIYLLLDNERLRDVISTVGQKAVLILGRFSPEERKDVLDGIAEKLRQLGFLPILFDFERSQERDFTETIRILAGLSLFVIADITNPRSSPLELQATVPDYRIPFVTILQAGEPPFAMFRDLTAYDWVLQPILTYGSQQAIVDGLEDTIVSRALRKHVELVNRKAEALRTTPIEDLMREITASKARSPT